MAASRLWRESLTVGDIFIKVIVKKSVLHDHEYMTTHI